MPNVFERGVKRIHVNQHIMRNNLKTGRTDPPITVQYKGHSYRGSSVDVGGPSELVYRPRKPLSCGARLFIETRAPVTLYQEAT